MKKTNDLARAYPDFSGTPKAVIAAVAYSLAQRIQGDSDGDAVAELLRAEWRALHENGIVPQRPELAGAEGGAA